MNNKCFRYSLIIKFISFAFIFCGCSVFQMCNPMRKNVMKDIADDVQEAVISKTPEGTYLVVKEEIFQATSKSDKGGFRQISGYVEFRISSYDINTGTLAKRIVLGEREKNYSAFLGETNGKLWYKSIDNVFGLHARDPKTLDVIVTQEKILEANPFLRNNISQPEWNSIARYYGFDHEKKMPMISDNSGYVYYLHPSTLQAEKTSESIKDFDFDNSNTSSSIKIDADKSVYLNGSPRKNINYMNRQIKEPSFLNGDFLRSSNVMNSADANPDFFNPYKKEISAALNKIDSFKNILNELDTNVSDRFKKIGVQNSMRNANRYIENEEDKIKRAEDNIKRYSDDKYYEIISDGSVFLISQTDVTDKAKIILSKVKLNPSDTSATLQWQTELQDYYRDPDKGFDKSSFEVVFSKGNPDLRTMRVLAYGDKLIFIFMLKAACIDMNSGKILWTVDL